MIRRRVGTLPERFELRNRPTLRFKPLSNLQFCNSTKIDSTQLVTAQVICMEHPAFFEILSVLSPQGGGNCAAL